MIYIYPGSCGLLHACICSAVVSSCVMHGHLLWVHKTALPAQHYMTLDKPHGPEAVEMTACGYVQVAFCPLTSGEVLSACSTLSDQGILQMSSQRGDRQCRITLRVSEDDVLAAVVDNRLLSNCLSL